MNRLKDRIRFGINVRKKLTGAELYVKILQITSLMPLLYIFLSSGYLAIFRSKSLYSVLFDLGIMALPRWETLGLSYIYRLTLSEIIVYFSIVIIALILGLMTNRIFKEDRETGIKARKVFAVLIAIDLVVRLIPMRFNLVLGVPAAVFGFIIRALCLVLIILDLKSVQGDK